MTAWDQLDLLAPSTRLHDPATSHAAAASLAGEGLRKGQAEVLDALVVLGGRGHAWAITETIQRWRHTAQQGCTAKRLGELEELGLVVRTPDTAAGPTGRSQIVWQVAS